jgi:hypothetical protein
MDRWKMGIIKLKKGETKDQETVSMETHSGEPLLQMWLESLKHMHKSLAGFSHGCLVPGGC